MVTETDLAITKTDGAAAATPGTTVSYTIVASNQGAIDVTDADGKVVNWDFELGPPNGLMRQGWNRNSLPQGLVVTINGFLSKDQANVANARSVHLPDGRQVLAGSSFDVDAGTPAQ